MSAYSFPPDSEIIDAVESDPSDPVMGNPAGDVTIVEFFDYNCPYCKQFDPAVAKLLAAYPDDLGLALVDQVGITLRRLAIDGGRALGGWGRAWAGGQRGAGLHAGRGSDGRRGRRFAG